MRGKNQYELTLGDKNVEFDLRAKYENDAGEQAVLPYDIWDEESEGSDSRDNDTTYRRIERNKVNEW